VQAMKIYISGPITGMPELNEPAFASASLAIAEKGHVPINPFDVCCDIPRGSDWLAYMRADIKAMMDADAVLMLSGWAESRGARIEHSISVFLEIPIYHSVDNIQ